MSEHWQINRLQVIYKTVERCNLACPYCYYFFGADQSYKDRPARTSLAVLDRLCTFLAKAVDDCGLSMVDVVFHGGEPMLQRLSDFEESCRRLRESVGPLCRLHLAIQTNGTRLRPEWTEVLKKYDVYIGVSIDGPAEVHDPSRPFHNGRGSLAKIASGLSEIRHEDPDFYKSRVGSLTVLNAANDYRSIIDYFSGELNLAQQSFLLPDCSHDDGIPDGWAAADYGRTLCAIFDRWVQQPDIKIREIDKVLRCFQRARMAPGVEAETLAGRDVSRRTVPNHIIVVQSDGTLKLDDSYIPASEWRERAPVESIFDVELGKYLEHPVFHEIFVMQQTPPSACESCRWVRICRGGDIENRWSSARKFDNPSVFCEGLKTFYTHVTGYLVANGYPEEFVEQRLSGNYDFVTDGYAA